MKGKKQFKFFQYDIFFADIASFCIVFEFIHKEIKKACNNGDRKTQKAKVLLFVYSCISGLGG